MAMSMEAQQAQHPISSRNLTKEQAAKQKPKREIAARKQQSQRAQQAVGAGLSGGIDGGGGFMEE